MIAELQNQACRLCDDAAWIKHYTSIIDVNPEDGIDYALYHRWDNRGAWDHSILELEAGTYTESIDIDNSEFIVKVVSKDGPAMISP